MRLLGLLPVAAAASSVLSAQVSGRAAGLVVRVAGRDTVPVPGIAVVLHRVSRVAQGPIDSLHTDRAGRFSLKFVVDTTASYLVSARYSGIEYFSAPLAPGRTPDRALVVVVFDTSSSAPAPTSSRTLLVSAPDRAGSRSVLDWFVIANRGTLTKSAADTSGVTWTAQLPLGVEEPHLADAVASPFSADAIWFRHDSVGVVAPIAPGEKELFIEYRVPARFANLRLRVAGIDSVDLLLETPGGGTVAPSQWVAIDSQVFNGRRFQRYAPSARRPQEIVVGFPTAGLAPELVLAGLAVTFGAALTLASWIILRRRGRGIPQPARAVPVELDLADRIARLDRAHAAGEAAVGAERWRAYLEQRARLKQDLEATLARQAPRA